MAIRIVLGDMPRLLHDIVVERLSNEGDMEIVGEGSREEEMERLARSPGTDVIVEAGDEDEPRGLGGRLLQERSRIKLVVLAADGRKAFLYRLTPERIALGQVSPQGLVAAIRAAVEPAVA